MNRYAYATVNRDTFLAMTRKPVPKDSYLTQDADTDAIARLFLAGYRVHTVLPDCVLMELPPRSQQAGK